MAGIIIEKLTSFSKKDAERVRHLASKLGSNYKTLTDKELHEILQSKSAHLFVARDSENREVVGMATLNVYRIPYLRRAYLDDLIVDENYRGQGIGSQLMKTVVALAKKLGASYIDFTSHASRTSANKLYEKLGFKIWDTNLYRLPFDYAEKK